MAGMVILRGIVYVWALPNTLLGMLFIPLALWGGGGVRLERGVLEVHGRAIRAVLRRLPFLAGGASAMTLGHVVLGVDEHMLDVTREHERVHVRQYERWGPLFIPAYLLAGLGVWLTRRHPYRDNPFERLARRLSG